MATDQRTTTAMLENARVVLRSRPRAYMFCCISRDVKLPLLSDLLDLVDVESASRAEKTSRALQQSRSQRLPGYSKPLDPNIHHRNPRVWSSRTCGNQPRPSNHHPVGSSGDGRGRGERGGAGLGVKALDPQGRIASRNQFAPRPHEGKKPNNGQRQQDRQQRQYRSGSATPRSSSAPTADVVNRLEPETSWWRSSASLSCSSFARPDGGSGDHDGSGGGDGASGSDFHSQGFELVFPFCAESRKQAAKLSEHARAGRAQKDKVQGLLQSRGGGRALEAGAS